MSIKVQIKELMDKIDKIDNSEERELQLEMMEGLEKDSVEYLAAVTNMENAINVARFRLEGEEFRDCISNLDNLRSKKHNVLISTVKVLNRLCFLHNIPSIYKGDVNNRYEIAEFAKEYIDELWKERRL